MSSNLFVRKTLGCLKGNLLGPQVFKCARYRHTLVTSEEHNGLRRIKMNDTKTKNSLSIRMMSELIATINHRSSDLSLRCITIESEDPKVFSAGHNLKELVCDLDLFNATDCENGIENQKQVFDKCTELMLSIKNADVPVISVVKGLAAAAGCQLVSLCDFAICTDDSTFSTPGSNFGLFCSTPGVGISRTMTKNMAGFMLFTGQTITASEALRAGLVSKVLPKNSIDQYLENDIYPSIKAKSRSVIKLGKYFYYRQLEMTLEDALRQGSETMMKNLQMQDSKEGLKSFREKRAPVWKHDA